MFDLSIISFWDLRRADGSIQRFTQAILSNELAEVSNKTLSTDLQELRVAFNRISTENARAVGWEVRLHEALQERDDFRQEMDNGTQKLRGAEARLTSLSDKCGEPRPQSISFFV
jgi:hypothetical protein